ncbi:MAG: hypothetical protein ACRCXD_13390 [Luteolibacter sp.]
MRSLMRAVILLESLIDSQFAALETPAEAITIDTDQSVDVLVSAILRELNLPTS